MIKKFEALKAGEKFVQVFDKEAAKQLGYKS